MAAVLPFSSRSIALPGFAQSPLSSQFAVPTGLIGYWGLDEDCVDIPNAQVYDISGTTNTGTISGASPPTLVDGKVGKALSFDGTTPYVLLTADVVMTSIAFWFKPSSANNDTIFINLAASQTLQTDGSSLWLIFDGANRGFATGPIIGSWNHYVFSHDGTNYNYWKNGVFTQARASNVISIGTIGRNLNGFTITGSMDDVRVYNRLLDAGDVNLLYAVGLQGRRDGGMLAAGAFEMQSAAQTFLFRKTFSQLGTGTGKRQVRAA